MQKNKDQKISRKSFHTVLVGHILVPRKCSKLTSLVSCFQLPFTLIGIPHLHDVLCGKLKSSQCVAKTALQTFYD